MYRTRRDELEGILLPMAEELGMKDFNFRSPPQRSKLLFDVLKLTPIETTEGKSWDWILNQNQDVQDMVSPATSKETMAILADEPGAHPIVALLRDISKLDYVCRSWLTDPAEAKNFNTLSKGGGLLAKIWPDGRIHARFSQLKETARFGSSRPNVQNWLKRAEGELKRIIGKEGLERFFGAGAKFPTLRSIIQPPPGWVLMEADWKQAEMFILAALSKDQTMWQALNTPGKDLHDLTAITAFGLTVLGPDGNPIPEQILLDLAKTNKKEFEALQSKLVYLDQRGRRLTRKQFKDGIRVSAKNLNFGIPYGRGSQDIAIQVKAETGTTESIHQLKDDIDQMMTSWKKSTYVDAWAYMQACSAQVVEPGYLINPWGRHRYFPKTYDERLRGAMGREAQNYNIQSTVADTCLITLWLMKKYREQHNLHFKIVNQIHDAILVEVPEDEVDATKKMFYDTMGNIDIPIPGADPLRLDVDIDVMKRWGEKD
jgi:DNA polymerase-1